ncbi:glycosyltransferase family 2 protein [Dyadobacter sp. NIV53]|uniref:glycosyltransferase family 2 protein n=1 Tax=Dyadobacter sp. NIV53 TaxID=2861765 RepID=UPI001C879EB7|nr:glycosyltransferase family 2 protein [Dyadobacter sp. NIV53]
MISVIIPVYNRLNYTLACIETLKTQTYPDFRIIVVDDGSTDSTSEVIAEKFPDVIVLKGDGNLWWTKAMNVGVQYVLGLKHSEKDFILALNNDLIVKPDYIEELVKAADKNPHSLIGSVSADINNPNSVHYAGIIWNPYLAYRRPSLNGSLELDQLQKDYEFIETSYLPGRGTLIPINSFKEIGLFDDVNFPQYNADHDYTLRAANAGYKLLVSAKAVVFSHVNDTGINTIKKLSFFKFLKLSLFSIKSPSNLKIRYRWAKVHSKSHHLIYFLIDTSRVMKSILVSSVKLNKSKS